jgi:hypothetical protein
VKIQVKNIGKYEGVMDKIKGQMIRGLVKILALGVMLVTMSGVVQGYPGLTAHELRWEGKNKPTSIHATNVNSDGKIGSELFEFPVNSKIYHIWLIAYSQWFADMYGYPNDYVSLLVGELTIV